MVLLGCTERKLISGKKLRDGDKSVGDQAGSLSAVSERVLEKGEVPCLGATGLTLPAPEDYTQIRLRANDSGHDALYRDVLDDAKMSFEVWAATPTAGEGKREELPPTTEKLKCAEIPLSHVRSMREKQLCAELERRDLARALCPLTEGTRNELEARLRGDVLATFDHQEAWMAALDAQPGGAPGVDLEELMLGALLCGGEGERVGFKRFPGHSATGAAIESGSGGGSEPWVEARCEYIVRYVKGGLMGGRMRAKFTAADANDSGEIDALVSADRLLSTATCNAHS